MDIFAWLIVGLVAGTLASLVSRGPGFGILGNIVLGIVGAFVGGWGFQQLGWHAPFAGVDGVTLVAFVGAMALLFVIHLVTRRGNR